jgi:hypothetical protein
VAVLLQINEPDISCSLRTIDSRSHLLMSAEPILVTDLAPADVRCARMKIHMAVDGAISLKRAERPGARWSVEDRRQNPVDRFQRVDESLGISDSWKLRALLAHVGFFYRGDARCACG